MKRPHSPSAPRPRFRPPMRHRRDVRGLATLEWLLVVAAAGGFAAAMSAGLDGLIADQITPTQPDTRIAYVESRLTAARINDRAITSLAALHSARADDATERIGEAEAQLDKLRLDCEDMADAYPAAVRRAIWRWLPIPLADPPNGHDTPDDDTAQADADNPDEPDEDAAQADADKPDEPDEDAAPDRADNSGRWVCALSGTAG